MTLPSNPVVLYNIYIHHSHSYFRLPPVLSLASLWNKLPLAPPWRALLSGRKGGRTPGSGELGTAIAAASKLEFS